MHDVQDTQLGNRRHKHGRNDCKILCNIVRNGEGGEGAAGDEQLLADLHHFQNFGGVRVQIHHVGGFLGCGGAGVHGQAHIGLGKGGGVVGAVAGHGNDFSLGLLFFDDANLVLGLALGNKTVHPGFLCNGGCGQGIVAGAHDGFDADGAQTLKTLCHAGLDGVFQVNNAQNLVVLAHDQGRAAQRRNFLYMGAQVSRDFSALRRNILLDGVRSALADPGAVGQVHAAHAGLGGELYKGRTGNLLAAVSQTASQFQRGFSLGGLVVKTGQSCTANQLAAACPLHGEEVGSQTVAKGDGARFVQNHGVHVATGLHGLAGHGDHIEPGDAVHTGDADGGQQAADGGGNQTNHQGDQGGQRQLNPAIHSDGVQGDNDNQKNDGQGDQKGAQGDFVGGLFPGGAFHQSDHAVQKAVAGIGGDLDFQPVGHHRGAAGH